MCITVEKAHIAELAKRFQSSIEKLIADAPNRAQDFILELDSAIAAPAIVFRDFPKLHGNIVQDAVGVALQSHVGGYSETDKTFKFLSSLNVSIDNFFLHSSGQIYLFETKRDMGQVRRDAAETSARKLTEVASAIAQTVKSRTGKSLRYPIKCAFFSFIDDHSSKVLTCNIASLGAPSTVKVPVYGRAEMNNLIGNCFGLYITSFDDLVGRLVSESMPHLYRRQEKVVADNPLFDILNSPSGRIVLGEDECKQATEEMVLED